MCVNEAASRRPRAVIGLMAAGGSERPLPIGRAVRERTVGKLVASWFRRAVEASDARNGASFSPKIAPGRAADASVTGTGA